MNAEIRARFLKYVTEIHKYSRSLGIKLSYGNNFSWFRNIPEIQPLRHPVNPAFDPNCCDIHGENGFWMVGYDASGEIVHTQAIKRVNMGCDTLEQHLDKQMWDFRTAGFDFDREKSHFFLTDGAKAISGTVTYHGELWLKGGAEGFRGGSLTVLLSRLILLECYLRYEPDYMIGFQSPRSFFRGLGLRLGYLRSEQRSLMWVHKDPLKKIEEDYFVWMSRAEAEFNLRLPPSFYYEMFEQAHEPKAMKISA